MREQKRLATKRYVQQQQQLQQQQQRQQANKQPQLICEEQITPFVDPVTLYHRQQQEQAQLQFQRAQQHTAAGQQAQQPPQQQVPPPQIPHQSQQYVQKPFVLPLRRKPKATPTVAAPPIIIPQRTVAVTKKVVTRTKAATNCQGEQRPKIVSAPKTPDRVSVNKRDADETPVIANTTSKKPKTTKNVQSSSGVSLSTTVGDQKIQGKKVRKKQQKKKKKAPAKLPKPVVKVEDLTYDWSSLNLDGTAAWNRMFKQRMLDDPITNPTVPQATAMDTYRLAKSLKDSLQTILPPEDSPLHEALRHDNKPSAESIASDMAQQRRLRFASAVPPPTPANCPDDLRPLYPRLAVLYQEMMAQDCCDEPSSLLRRSYQYMTATELRQHMIAAEQDVAALAAKEERVLRTAKKLGLWKNSSNDEAPSVAEESASGMDIDESEKKPLFWRQDFESLLKNGGTATKYLMHHDQY